MKAIPFKELIPMLESLLDEHEFEFIAGLVTLAFVHWVWCMVSYYLMLMPDKKKNKNE